jgi:hypothetical protein
MTGKAIVAYFKSILSRHLPRVKVKVKLYLCLTKRHAMKAYRGSEGIAPPLSGYGNSQSRMFM